MQYTFNTIAFIATLYAIGTENQDLIRFSIGYWIAVIIMGLVTISVDAYKRHRTNKILKEAENEIENALMNAVRRHEKYVFNKDKGQIEKEKRAADRAVKDTKTEKRILKTKSK